MRATILRFLLLLFSLTLLAGSAPADITTFSSFSAWSAATSSPTYLDLASYANGTSTMYTGGFTADDITFTSNNGQIWVIDDQYGGGQYNHGVGPESVTANYGWRMDFSGLTSVGFNMTTLTYNNPTHITLSTGDTFDVTTNGGYPGWGYPGSNVFFGVTSDTAFTWIRFEQSNDYPVVGSIYTGTSTSGNIAPGGPVPEPGSMVLFGSGLIFAARFIRRRRRD